MVEGGGGGVTDEGDFFEATACSGDGGGGVRRCETEERGGVCEGREENGGRVWR